MNNNGVTFGNKNSFTDWDLLMTSKTIGEAVPKTKYLEIPGRDGTLDFTESTGEVKYYVFRTSSLDSAFKLLTTTTSTTFDDTVSLKENVYYLTSDYKTRNNDRSNHNGMDFIGNNRSADYIIAIEEGRVITSKYSLTTGYYVEIEHRNKYISRYLHMMKLKRNTYGQRLVKRPN